MSKNLILGAGEVGKALHSIFSRYYVTEISDINPPDFDDIEILHIAFPDSDSFIANVQGYIAKYQPDLTIIHSTVRIGTTEQCGDHVVHSPIRGRHPNLVTEMLVYPKFIGGDVLEDVDKAAAFIESCHWTVVKIDSSKQTEVLKLLSNVHMGLEIAWRQEVSRVLQQFDDHGTYSDEMYRIWEGSYFDGYKRLDQSQLIRPRMSPRPIGGHCIVECTKLLQAQHQSKAFEFILESNERAKQEVLCETK